MSALPNDFLELLQKEAEQDDPEIVENQEELDFLSELEKEAGADPEFVPDSEESQVSMMTANPDLEKVASDFVSNALDLLSNEVDPADLVKLASEDPMEFKHVLAAALLSDEGNEASSAADIASDDGLDVSGTFQAYLNWKQRSH
jgi:hypothetical protein